MSKHFAVRLIAGLLMMGVGSLSFAQAQTTEQPQQTKTEEQQKAQQERQEARQEQRTEQQQAREKNRETREGVREENRDDRKDSRDARQDTRNTKQDARDKVQDTRNESRGDRRDVRTENRPELRQRVQSFFRGRTVDDLGLRFGDNQSGRLTISEVDRNGLANRLGFRLGDIILSLNGQGISTSEDFDRELGANPDRTGTFIIQRNGRQYSIQLPAQSTSYGAGMSQSPRAYLGVIFDPNYRESAVIREVKSDSPAEKIGLKPGDTLTHIKGREVRSLADALRTLSMMPAGEEFEIEYDRPKHETAKVSLAERQAPPTYTNSDQSRGEQQDRNQQD